LTVVAWFRTTTTSGFQRVATWQTSGADTIASILLNYPSAGSVANQTYKGGVNALPSISGMSANTWHHAAVVSQATSNTVYLDGVQGSVATYMNPSFTSVNRFHVGYTPSTQYHSGSTCEVGVYSVALTASEIGALADGYTPIEIRPQSLVAYYPLGGHYGQLDVDRWKNRYDLTAYNSPTWADHPRVFYPRRSFWFPSPIVASTTVYTLEASPATVDVIGQSASLSAVRKLAAQPATIEVVGQEATLRVIRKIVASPATVDVVGQAATLTKARTLTANAAEVQVSGQAAGLTATRKITASPAAIEVVGQSANLRVVRRIVASPATVEVSGQTAVTRRTALLQGLAATIAVVGQAAVLTYSGEAAVVTEDWIGVDKATGRTPKATATHRVGTATAIGRVSKATAYQRPQ
jgi:hypothetical protein